MKKVIDTEYYNNIYYTTISIADREIINFTATSKININKIIKIINNNFDYSYKLEFSGLKEVKNYFNI